MLENILQTLHHAGISWTFARARCKVWGHHLGPLLGPLSGAYGSPCTWPLQAWPGPGLLGGLRPLSNRLPAHQSGGLAASAILGHGEQRCMKWRLLPGWGVCLPYCWWCGCGDQGHLQRGTHSPYHSSLSWTQNVNTEGGWCCPDPNMVT